MSHWRTSRAILGGGDRSPGSLRQDTQRNLFPSSTDLSFPRGDFSQTLIDIATLILCALFVCISGVGITAAIFILLFVRV